LSIVRDGWQPTDVIDTVADVATAHDLDPEDVIEDLEKYYRFTLHAGRGTTSFAPNRRDAEHAWAQRAPEAKYESLWAVYRIKHMRLDDPWYWNTDVAGHAWVWDQMRADQLAVVSYTTCYAEMVELVSMTVGCPPLKLQRKAATADGTFGLIHRVHPRDRL
jgi:hypothetical protein